MKKILLVLLCLPLLIMAQAPQGFTYQGVATDNNGSELQNQNIAIKASLLSSSATGTTVWQETHTTSTDTFGLFNVTIGEGTTTNSGSSATFQEIDWGVASHFMKVEIDVNGGTNYVHVGTSQMMSVPYALYAENAQPSGTDIGEMMFWDGADWVVVAPPSVVFSNPPSLMFVNGAPTWSTPVLGCTDSLAANYNYLANINDSSCIAMAMGVYHKGGIVIWLDSTGQHGLICDIKDMGGSNGSVTWGCYGTVTGASGIAIGTGQQNTIDILANCTVSGPAADLCVNSSAQGYTDWFLPSKYELHQIYINRIAVDAISLLYGGNVLTSGSDYLWSSSENTANEAWYEKIDAGIHWSANKGISINIRAVRAF